MEAESIGWKAMFKKMSTVKSRKESRKDVASELNNKKVVEKNPQKIDFIRNSLPAAKNNVRISSNKNMLNDKKIKPIKSVRDVIDIVSSTKLKTSAYQCISRQNCLPRKQK